jgi:hypothetical protein
MGELLPRALFITVSVVASCDFETIKNMNKQEFLNVDSDKHDVRHSLPDIYSGKLNAKRIKKYRKLAQLYNIEDGTVRDIFCAGADWFKKVAEGNDA